MQDIPEAYSQGILEALNILSHIKSKFSFQPRIRNSPLITIFFDVEISENSVEISEHSVKISKPLIEISKTSVEAGEDFDAYTEDDDFSETSVKSDEDKNNTFKDYSTPDFKFPLDSTEVFEDTRFA